MPSIRSITIENDDYIIISGGYFFMGMGSAYILDKKGNLKNHYTLDRKPNKKILQKLLDNYTERNKK